MKKIISLTVLALALVGCTVAPAEPYPYNPVYVAPAPIYVAPAPVYVPVYPVYHRGPYWHR